MASSALPEVLEYLETALTKAEDLTGVTILWGPPTGDDAPKELVCVGFGEDNLSGQAERDWKLIGPKTLDEEITVALTSEVLNTASLKAAYERSYEISASVEAVVRGDPTLGGLLLAPARIHRWTGRYFRTGEASGHRVFQTLTGMARI